ncbi:hypothetical protein CI102_6271 [Trichoderma harzianum]|nr:hypothetical protein CI102_6271 [Trichoderma harzianum]
MESFKLTCAILEVILDFCSCSFLLLCFPNVTICHLLFTSPHVSRISMSIWLCFKPIMSPRKTSTENAHGCVLKPITSSLRKASTKNAYTKAINTYYHSSYSPSCSTFSLLNTRSCHHIMLISPCTRIHSTCPFPKSRSRTPPRLSHPDRQPSSPPPLR